jgi:hypothetical protein
MAEAMTRKAKPKRERQARRKSKRGGTTAVKASLMR